MKKILQDFLNFLIPKDIETKKDIEQFEDITTIDKFLIAILLLTAYGLILVLFRI